MNTHDIVQKERTMSPCSSRVTTNSTFCVNPSDHSSRARVDSMTWTKPEHSKKRVQRAGKVLASQGSSPQELNEARAIVDNWRSAHGYPLNAISTNLRNWATQINGEVTLAQRRKRMPSIVNKLRRMPNLSVSAMQDLGGCRLIVPTVEDIYKIEKSARRSTAKHVLVNDRDDYILSPRKSGYRSRHMVFRYQSTSNTNRVWNGLNIEVQLRTRLQHAWATAVETVGTFHQQDLKSGAGDPQWLRFFQLASGQFALTENTQPVPGTPERHHLLLNELEDLMIELRVIDKLTGFMASLHLESSVREKDSKFIILMIDVKAETLTMDSYSDDIDAQTEYALIEAEQNPHVDAVLVSVDKTDLLRNAYPNYFADTSLFIDTLERLFY